MSRLVGADNGPTLVAQSVMEDSATAKAAVGAYFALGDRKFRYCKNGSVALAAGLLVQGPALHATYFQNIAVQAAAAAGATAVSVTLPNQDNLTLVANQLAGGYLSVYDVSTGVGETYKIKSHIATTKNTTATFNLYDGLVTALTTSDKVSLAPSKYNLVVVSPATTATNVPVGVPLVAITASYYFWAQVSGPSTALADGAWVMGQPLVRSLGTAGALRALAGGSVADVEKTIATAFVTTASTKYGQCELCIE